MCNPETWQAMSLEEYDDTPAYLEAYLAMSKAIVLHMGEMVRDAHMQIPLCVFGTMENN